MKPVGEPDAGNRHVLFDERGRETEPFMTTAPFLDSTQPWPPQLKNGFGGLSSRV